MADDVVTTELVVQAQQALRAFREYESAANRASGSIKSLRQSVNDFERVVASEAQKANITFEQQLALFKQMDTQLRSQKKKSIFGPTSKGVDPFGAVQERHNSLSFLKEQEDALLAYNKAMLSQADGVGRIKNSQEELGDAYNKTGEKLNSLKAVTLDSVKTFAKTAQGQGILSNFLGSYQQAGNVRAQIDSIKTAVGSLSKETGASFRQSGQVIREQFGQIPGIANQVNQATREMGKGFEDASKKSVGGINLIRTALHVLAASAIFGVIGAFTKLFSMAINGLRELETATYNIVNAERKLSEMGVEITPKDLDSYIKKLQILDPLLSKIQATELVSTVATKVAPNVGLGAEEIESLTQSIAILAVRNKGLGKSFEEVESQITNAFLSGKVSIGINQLGVKISDQIVKEKALAMGLVKTAEAYERLTAVEESRINALAMVQILEENTNEERSRLPEYFETADAAFGVFQANLQNLLTTIGVQFGPLLAQAFGAAADGLASLNEWFEKNKDGIAVVINSFAALIEKGRSLEETSDNIAKSSLLKTFVKVGDVILGVIPVFQNFDLTVAKLATIMQVAVEKALTWIPAAGPIISAVLGIRNVIEGLTNAVRNVPALQNIADQYGLDEIGEVPDTPTGIPEEIELDTSGAREELADLLKDLEKLQDKIDETESEHALDIARFDEDALIDRNRAIEDYNLNVLQATRAYDVQRRESNQKYRQKEMEDERKFQENMRKLQEDFLYNLEDALRERDARQVLRLIDKYNMEKEAMVNENALRQQASSEQQSIEQQERRNQLDERLRVMAEEQAVKMQRMDDDSKLKRDRMVQDHQLEMADLRAQMDERILEAANKMAEEYGLNQEGAQAIYDLLKSYYGSDGSLAALTSEGYAAMLADATGFLGSLMAIVGQYQALMAAMGSMGGMAMPISRVPRTPVAPISAPGFPTQHVPGFAEGGRFITTRPTQFIAGEQGAEMVTVTPLNQIMDSTSMTGQAGTMGANGQTQINLMVDLSPDLEARVVDKALNETANVVTRINRSK